MEKILEVIKVYISCLLLSVIAIIHPVMAMSIIMLITTYESLKILKGDL